MSETAFFYTRVKANEITAEYRRFTELAGMTRILLKASDFDAHLPISSAIELRDQLDAAIEEAITARYASEEAISLGRALFAGAKL